MDTITTLHLKKLGARVIAIFDEIYSDLHKHASIIRYIPENDRKNLIKMIYGLFDICKMTRSNTGYGDKCVSILTLSASETRTKSRVNDRELDAAIKLIQNGGKESMSRNDRMDLVRKAMENGEKSAAKNDPRRMAFLQEVSKGKGREFLGDVWLKLSFSSNSRSYTGKCGRVLCSAEYLDHVEKHVFGRDVPNYYSGRNGDRSYGKMMEEELEKLVSSLLNDLSKGVVGKNYMKKEAYETTIAAGHNLAKIPYVKSKLSNFDKLIAPFFTDIIHEIKKLKEEAGELIIDDYKVWTDGEAAFQFLAEKFDKIFRVRMDFYKEEYVKGIAKAILSLEDEYEIPGVMMAGIAYNEFAGDPPSQDYIVYHLRNNKLKHLLGFISELQKPGNYTSFGNISMQLRRAAETLKYYKDLDSTVEGAMVDLLEDDRTALILVVRHLVELKNIDFPNKNGMDLSDDEMAIVVGRYNMGPDVTAEKAQNCSYAQRFLNMKPKLYSWINQNNLNNLNF